MDPRASRLAWPALYVALALAVAGPLLAPGYVFALDHAMGPRAAEYYSSYLAHNADPIQSKGGYAILLHVLDWLLPMWVAQKLILFLPFFLAGYGAHLLVARKVGAAAAVFGGLLYALSPFAYLRGVSGQTGVLWAYALAPWFLRAWLSYLEGGARRSLLAAALLLALTIVFQAHGAIILVLLVGALALAQLASAPRAWWPALRAPLILGAWSIALNAYWLVPVALAPQTTLTNIGAGDREFFATTSAGLPSVGLAALTLQGFWREAYASPFPSALLLVVPAIVLLLSVHALARRSDVAGRGLALAGVIGLLLAVGTSSPATAWLADIVWDKVPFMRGFRDAHKLLALLALAYAYLAPLGLDALLRSLSAARIPRLAPIGVTALVLFAPLATATPLLGGYAGQLGVADYPAEWKEMEETTRDCDGAMLILPWHLYMDQTWLPNADKRVTDPAKLYFSCPTLTSDAIELGSAADQASTPAIRYVDHWMRDAGITNGNPRGIHTLGELLSPVGVRYVLLLKTSDWRDVGETLDEQRDLRVIVDNPRVRLYENLAEVPPPLHGVDEVMSIRDIDELVAISETRPLARIAFHLGDGPALQVASAYTPSPRAHETRWKLGGADPAFLSLGFAPAFTSPPQGSVRDASAQGAIAAMWSASGLAVVGLLLWSRRGDVRG